MKAGFIGAGNMAFAIACGIAKSSQDMDFFVSDPSVERQQYFTSKIIGGCITHIGNNGRIEIT